MSRGIIEIVKDLRALGVENGDKLMVHSSFKSLGKVDGGISTFVTALEKAVGDEGTLMFPTFSYVAVNSDNPVFDVKATPCCVGAIPEFFRKTVGVKRSVHPTHSIAVWGKDRDEYIKNHHMDDVCVAENSPLYKLKDTGGKILMVGCGITHNTLIHGVECYIRPPYAFTVDYCDPTYHREYTCIHEDGTITTQAFYHMFTEPVGWYQDYDKLKGLVEMREGKILDADCYLMDAKTVWDTVLHKMENEPYYFVSQTLK